jgi:phosphate starvation-inducible protein PhoH
MDNILTHVFGDEDVVRNPLITKILKKYEDKE